MAVFKDLSVLLEVKYLSLKEKKKLKSAVVDNGGSICFVVNKQCSLVVTNDVSSLSSNRLKSIQKHQIPVVNLDYIYCCVQRAALLPVDQYKMDVSADTSPISLTPTASVIESKVPTSVFPSVPSKDQTEPCQIQNDPGKFRIFAETDPDLPAFPEDFQVAKYSFYEEDTCWYVLELQSCATKTGRSYRVVQYKKDCGPPEKPGRRDQLVFPSNSEEALDIYESLRNTMKDSGLRDRDSLPPLVEDLGSAPLQQLLLEEKLNTENVSQEVALFVELLWTEALGCLDNVLRVSIDQLSLNDVSTAEGLLLQARKKLKTGDHGEASELLNEVYNLLPHRDPQAPPPSSKLLSQKLDLCQLIRDVVNLSEMTLSVGPVPSTLGKFSALRCSIDVVPSGDAEFQSVADLLQGRVQIQQIFRVRRGVEIQKFRKDLGNIRPLLHSSSPNNFVGILSRGLLLPHVGLEHHGIQRTDIGNLGCGIYFSNDMSTSLKYSKPGATDGSRLLLVCDVALGSCKNTYKRDPTLTQAPDGYHSMHGVCESRTVPSEFEDDEYVVYSPDQVQLKYVVQFCMDQDQLKEFMPQMDMSLQQPPAAEHQELRPDEEEFVQNPVNVTAGLQDTSGQQLPLQAVYVKCKLMDLLSQVVIFQEYTNRSSVAIEAKYVFPLEDSAAVCGFEAFINGKHVVGQVKEKEKARKEYREAIEQGHGAYLMDQDAPDVFTISVGNLPAGATVLIKISFISELPVEDGSILFSLPGSVAPWQQRAALNQTTQVDLEKVCVGDAAGTREFTLDISVEMPHEILSINTTHKVKIKKTDCKAVISVLPGEELGVDGFQLSMTLSQVHLPRMWVERHPDKDSQACMLVFYPDFELRSTSAADEVILLLDTSESMKGETLRSAQRIALQILRQLDHKLRVNIILFGKDHKEAFLTAQPLSEVHQAAESFIKSFSPVGGSTELWRPLRALNLLPPSCGVRNLLLLSDGHIHNSFFTLQLLRENTKHSRLFTCGLSPSANRHMLRALAQAGGGAYEFFDNKSKQNWDEKVASQVKRMSSPGCNSVSVKWQQFNTTAPPLQAPKQVHALFKDCHTLVYGFVPHCTQATLFGNLEGVELKTVVSTSELQKTNGTFLHKLAARALIRDYEDGSLETSEAEHESRKAELKSFIIELSKEYSILSQFTSFVAIEKRDSNQAEDGVTDIPKLVAEEDVDFLPYMSWCSDRELEDDSSLSESSELRGAQTMDDDEANYDVLKYVKGCSIKCFSYEPLAGTAIEEQEIYDDLGTEGLIGDLRTMSADMASLIGTGPPPAGITPGLFGKQHYLPTMLVPSPAMVPPSFTTAPAPAGITSAHFDMPPPGAAFCPSVMAPTTAGLKMAFSDMPPPPAMAPQCLGRETIGMPPPLCSMAPPPPAMVPPFGTAPAPAGITSALFGMPPPGTALRPGVMAPTTAGLKMAFSDMPPPPPMASHCFGRAPAGMAPPPSNMQPFGSLDSILMAATVIGDQKLDREFDKEIGKKSRKKLRAGGFGCRPEVVSAEPEEIEMSHNVGKMSKLIEGVHHSELSADKDLRVKNQEEGRRSRTFRTKETSQLFGSSGFSGASSTYLELMAPCSSIFQTLESDTKWARIFQLQNLEGFWDLTNELGDLINLNVDVLVNVFLKNKGIRSLGVKAHEDILRMLATLLVLQLMRIEKLEVGQFLHTLFRLEEGSTPSSLRLQQVRKAVDWVCWADRQYPCVCSRLEFGLNWESSTRQLLGFESLPPFSPLRDLELQRPVHLLAAH